MASGMPSTGGAEEMARATLDSASFANRSLMRDDVRAVPSRPPSGESFTAGCKLKFAVKLKLGGVKRTASREEFKLEYAAILQSPSTNGGAVW